MKGSKMLRILRDWYKPTKRGEQARQILMNEELGAIGEDVDEVETPESGKAQ